MLQPRFSRTGLHRIYPTRRLTNGLGTFQIRLGSTTTLPRPKDTSQNVSQQRTQYPLSAMPTAMLLRSLFIATISSTKALLIPSLHLLSFLSKPDRSFLFNIDRNPVLKAILKRSVYKQFCGGETAQETKECVKQLKSLGFKGVILTYAREILFDHKAEEGKQNELGVSVNGSEKAAFQHDADIEAWRAGTLETLALISKGDILAIKTTGAGPAVSAAFSKGQLPPAQMMSALEEVAAICTHRGIQVIVDAESQHWQHGIAATTLSLMRQFNQHGQAVIYNTYQAYLKSTPALISQHMAEAAHHNFTLGLKLVRGAYIDSDNRALIHDTKQDTDEAYDRIAQRALCRQYPDDNDSNSSSPRPPFPSLALLLASHNRASLMTAASLHQHRRQAGLPTVPVSYAQLQGMSDQVSFSLLALKDENGAAPDVYKCTTWGAMSECMGYLVRRAVENRDAVLRTEDEFRVLRREVVRRLGG